MNKQESMIKDLEDNLFEYALHLNTVLGVNSLEKATVVFLDYKKNEVIDYHSLTNFKPSLNKFIAILAVSLDLQRPKEFSLNEVRCAWDLYWHLKDNEHI